VRGNSRHRSYWDAGFLGDSAGGDSGSCGGGCGGGGDWHPPTKPVRSMA